MKVKNNIWVAVLFCPLLLTSCTSRLNEPREEPSENESPEEPRVAKLVSYYTFNQKNAKDSSGFGYDGISQGAVTYESDTPDGDGYSAHLNAFMEPANINIPYNVFSGQLNYSIAFWIKDFSFGVIMNAISSDGIRSDFPRIYATSSNCFRFVTCYDNWDQTESFDYNNIDLMDSGWHHIAFVAKSTDPYFLDIVARHLYVDGSRVASDAGKTQKYVNYHGWDEDIITKVQVGGDRNGAYEYGISMFIDNIRFYTGALTDAEVKELFVNRL